MCVQVMYEERESDWKTVRLILKISQIINEQLDWEKIPAQIKGRGSRTDRVEHISFNTWRDRYLVCLNQANEVIINIFLLPIAISKSTTLALTIFHDTKVLDQIRH